MPDQKPPRVMSPLGSALFEMTVQMTSAEARIYERHGCTSVSRVQACREVGRLQRLHEPLVLDALKLQRGEQ